MSFVDYFTFSERTSSRVIIHNIFTFIRYGPSIIVIELNSNEILLIHFYKF